MSQLGKTLLTSRVLCGTVGRSGGACNLLPLHPSFLRSLKFSNYNIKLILNGVLGSGDGRRLRRDFDQISVKKAAFTNEGGQWE